MDLKIHTRPLMLAVSGLIGLFSVTAHTASAEQLLELNQKFTLIDGQSLTSADNTIQIKFGSVVADTRCPQDSTCLLAGKLLLDIVASNEKASHHAELDATTIGSPSSTLAFGAQGQYTLTILGVSHADANNQEFTLGLRERDETDSAESDETVELLLIVNDSESLNECPDAPGPICAAVESTRHCFIAPCNLSGPLIYKTFRNQCAAAAENALLLHHGACQTTPDL